MLPYFEQEQTGSKAHFDKEISNALNDIKRTTDEILPALQNKLNALLANYKKEQLQLKVRLENQELELSQLLAYQAKNSQDIQTRETWLRETYPKDEALLQQALQPYRQKVNSLRTQIETLRKSTSLADMLNKSSRIMQLEQQIHDLSKQNEYPLQQLSKLNELKNTIVQEIIHYQSSNESRNGQIQQIKDQITQIKQKMGQESIAIYLTRQEMVQIPLALAEKSRHEERLRKLFDETLARQTQAQVEHQAKIGAKIQRTLALENERKQLTQENSALRSKQSKLEQEIYRLEAKLKSVVVVPKASSASVKQAQDKLQAKQTQLVGQATTTVRQAVVNQPALASLPYSVVTNPLPLSPTKWPNPLSASLTNMSNNLLAPPQIPAPIASLRPLPAPTPAQPSTPSTGTACCAPTPAPNLNQAHAVFISPRYNSQVRWRSLSPFKLQLKLYNPQQVPWTEVKWLIHSDQNPTPIEWGRQTLPWGNPEPTKKIMALELSKNLPIGTFSATFKPGVWFVTVEVRISSQDVAPALKSAPLSVTVIEGKI